MLSSADFLESSFRLNSGEPCPLFTNKVFGKVVSTRFELALGCGTGGGTLLILILFED